MFSGKLNILCISICTVSIKLILELPIEVPIQNIINTIGIESNANFLFVRIHLDILPLPFHLGLLLYVEMDEMMNFYLLSILDYFLLHLYFQILLYF